MSKIQFCICGCYFSRNIFIKSIELHTTYLNDEQFLKDYGRLINRRNLQPDSILQEVHDEIERRKRFINETESRRQLIKNIYKPENPNLFDLQESFMHPEFIKLAQICNSVDSDAAKICLLKYQIEDETFQLYQFPIFTEEFCKKLITEIKHFLNSEAPKVQPNTMNKYGVLLDDIGFTPFMNQLRNNYLNSISKFAYPEWVGNGLDSHRAFTVYYSMEADRKLDYHFDNAEVTLNISLNENYFGANLVFSGLKNESKTNLNCAEVKHKLGWAILHRGRQLHTALPLTDGERYNLIFWMRSSSIRNENCPMCAKSPQFSVVNGYFGDGFTLI